MRRYLTPKQIAELVGIAHDGELDWIGSGELPATQVGRRRDARRPTYRVAVEDLEDFLARRRTQPPPARPRCRRKLPAVTQYV